MSSQENNLVVISEAFMHGGAIPKKYTCDGENINPPLAVEGIQADAISIVVIMEDPDVPKNVRADGMWNHWIVFDIGANGDELVIAEGEKIEGIYGKNTSGINAYGGPCPPDREHRYFFRVYTLDCILKLPEGSTKSEVLDAMNGHVLQETVLMGVYDRS